MIVWLPGMTDHLVLSTHRGAIYLCTFPKIFLKIREKMQIIKLLKNKSVRLITLHNKIPIQYTKITKEKAKKV